MWRARTKRIIALVSSISLAGCALQSYVSDPELQGQHEVYNGIRVTSDIHCTVCVGVGHASCLVPQPLSTNYFFAYQLRTLVNGDRIASCAFRSDLMAFGHRAHSGPTCTAFSPSTGETSTFAFDGAELLVTYNRSGDPFDGTVITSQNCVEGAY
jgi:hypothetical protein